MEEKEERKESKKWSLLLMVLIVLLLLALALAAYAAFAAMDNKCNCGTMGAGYSDGNGIAPPAVTISDAADAVPACGHSACAPYYAANGQCYYADGKHYYAPDCGPAPKCCSP